MKTVWLAAAAAAALLTAAPAASFAADAATAPKAPVRDLTKAPRMGTWGFDLAGRDAATTPGQSLFGHANGRYMQRLEIPSDRSSITACRRALESSSSTLKAPNDERSDGISNRCM